MRVVMGFVKTTLIGGLLFLLPAVIVIAILRQALSIARQIAAPLAARLAPGTTSLAGMPILTLVAVLLLVVVCLAAGLFARTAAGKKVSSKLEWMVLRWVPGYRSLKAMLAVSEGGDPGFSVVLARIEDAWQLAFLMERLDGGLLAVFVPAAPEPWSGSVFYLTPDRIQEVDVPVRQALGCIRRMGTGSRELLRGKIAG